MILSKKCGVESGVINIPMYKSHQVINNSVNNYVDFSVDKHISVCYCVSRETCNIGDLK